jgi:hypothetical protein
MFNGSIKHSTRIACTRNTPIYLKSLEFKVPHEYSTIIRLSIGLSSNFLRPSFSLLFVRQPVQLIHKSDPIAKTF